LHLAAAESLFRQNSRAKLNIKFKLQSQSSLVPSIAWNEAVLLQKSNSHADKYWLYMHSVPPC